MDRSYSVTGAGSVWPTIRRGVVDPQIAHRRVELVDAVTVHTADLQGLDGFSVQDEGQRLGHLSIGMRRDTNLELQRRRRGDLDFELSAHIASCRPMPAGRESATKTTRCGPLAPTAQRLTLPGCCPAFGIPRGLGRSHFLACVTRVVLRRTPARSMSVTVNEVRVATVVDPPMSAWLPITRSSVMCVMTVSLSARRSELLVGVGNA
jgi:hypothetical protein